MGIIAGLLILLVAVEHIYILIIEMFFSESKVAQRSFGLEKEFLKDERVKIMMANQGLYNGFLAMGLIWSIFETGAFQVQLAIFFSVMCCMCGNIWCCNSFIQNSSYAGSSCNSGFVGYICYIK